MIDIIAEQILDNCDDWKQRFVHEYSDLVKKMHKLDRFIEMNKDAISTEALELLKEQYGYMSQYEDVLYRRAKLYEIELPTWKDLGYE
jgi:hypothetical protein